MIGRKLEAYAHAKHERHLTRTDQSSEEYLRNGGWTPAPEQDGKKVWKDPETKSSFFEPEALRRQDSRPFEDKIIMLLELQRVALEQREETGGDLVLAAGKKYQERIVELEKELIAAKGQLTVALAAHKPAPEPTIGTAANATHVPANRDGAAK